MKQKGATLSLLVRGQGESHSEEVDICAYSSGRRIGSSLSQSLTQLPKCTIDFKSLLRRRKKNTDVVHTQDAVNEIATSVYLPAL